ncbi:carboxypeptidase-like regulatory domain-containing protein [Deinococcus aquatilis]|uniref:carboxypeptidase-like regulatory domain-containing protein n=1 Tax=Deinococcus aquatilis TaxID=519440 RepID=UPI0003A11B7A|nr:carboxypeptidase-like regulatory domain-containing protein [Deinococcus aquatilis]
MNGIRKSALLLTALLGLSLSMTGCGGAGATPPPGVEEPPPAGGGYVTGKIVDEQGRPVVHAEVVADNTLLYNTNVIGYTDAAGTYKLDIRKPVGTWHVTATMNLNYEGETIPVDLVPETDDLLAGTVGGVRNFTFKPAQTQYGSLGLVNIRTGIAFYGDLGEMTVTLKSVGTLADGSSNQTIVAKPVQSGDGYIIKNVMYGTYNATVSYQGQDLFVRKAVSSGTSPAYSKTFTGGFWRDFYTLRPTMFLEVSDVECPPILERCQ